MKKVEKSSSAGTEVESSTNAHDSQVSQPCAKPNVGGSTVTYECVQCGWIGTKNNFCPNCNCKSFYESITKAKPCDICGDEVLVLERIDKPLDGVLCGKCHSSMIDDDYEDDEDDFQCCDNCDLPDACADFGCAIKSGVRKYIEW